jgi:peroxiredoxin
MISPQTEEHTRKFASLKGLTMDVLVDAGSTVAEAFGLVFAVPDELRKVYRQFGIDLGAYNADESWKLPLPARYIIDRAGVIRYAEVSTDYKVRPDPDHTIEALKRMKH